MTMIKLTEEDPVLAKTRELCQFILEHPPMAEARKQIDAFMQDDQARQEYQSLASKHQALQQKQQMAMELSDEEVADFEAQREKVIANPTARGFLDAQETMHAIQHSVTKVVSMALENGKVPTDEDLQAASCGHGCNCH
jgi:cell fate (sporulation/competence/biofilm development) regulator YlbF (YheA/YmcA/DUF963 family)